MDFIIGIPLEFGLGIIGLIILLRSAIRARSVETVLNRGIIAMIFLALQCALMGFLVTTFSQIARPDITRRGELMLKVVIVISIVSLIIYFPVAVSRANRSQKKSGDSDDAT
jgi:uncharacterized membrane-anchored protein